MLEENGRKIIAYKPIALDGGYGWVIVFGSFLIHVFADGFVYSFGVIAESLIHEFYATNTQVSTILSLLTGLMLAAGPVASAVCNRIGCRITTIIGAIIASFGCAISYQATSMTYLIFSVGIVMGTGFGLMYCPAIVIVTMYFERYRSLATGVTVCGAGAGTFAFSKIIGFLILNFDWRTVFLIYAGIVLLCVPCGALYRPIKFEPIYKAEEEDDKKRDQNEENETKHEPKDKTTLPNGIHKRITVGTEIIPEEDSSDIDEDGPKLSSNHTVDQIRQSISQMILSNTAKNTDNGVLQRFRSLGEHLHIRSSGTHQPHRRNSHRRIGIAEKNNKNTISISTGYLNVKDVFYNRSITTLTEYAEKQSRFRSITSLHSNNDSKNGQNIHKTALSGSIREQLNTTGSKLLAISVNDDTTSKLSLDKSAVAMIVANECQDNYVLSESVGNDYSATEIWRTVKRLMDLSLLVDPVYLLFAISNFLTSIGFNAPPMFMPMNAESVLKFDKLDAASTVSAYGLANLFGRIAFGLICDRQLPFRWGRDCARNRLWIYNWTLMLCGLASAFVFLMSSFPSYMAYCFFFGFMISSYVCLTSVVLVDLVGVDRLTNAFGLLLFIQGIATFVGPPIAGWLFDLTQSYDWTFAFCGICLFISGIIMFAIPIIVKRQRNHVKIPIANIVNGTAKTTS